MESIKTLPDIFDEIYNPKICETKGKWFDKIYQFPNYSTPTNLNLSNAGTKYEVKSLPDFVPIDIEELEKEQ